METVLLIIVLLVAALALIVLEICTPTFGLASVLSVACLGGAVYLCFTIAQWLGIVAVVAAVTLYPVFIIAAVKRIPHTRLGNLLGLPARAVEPGTGTPEALNLTSLVGRETTAETVLRPSGTIRIDGQRVIAQAESGMIERGANVKIIAAAGNYVVVRHAGPGAGA